MRAWLNPPLSPANEALSDPAYREAVVDLLGVISYGEISAFERLAEDAKLAPTLQDKLALGTMASVELTKVAALHQRITDLAADPFAAMEPFQIALDSFHRHTAPSDWLEGLVKAFVGDGLANDFYREIAAFLDPQTRDLVVASLDDDGGHASVRRGQGARAHRRRSAPRRPARAVGSAPDGRGVDPGAARRGRP